MAAGASNSMRTEPLVTLQRSAMRTVSPVEMYPRGCGSKMYAMGSPRPYDMSSACIWYVRAVGSGS